MTPTIIGLTMMVSLLLLVVPAPGAAAAGPAPRVGLLWAGSRSDVSQSEVDAFRQGLRELGHVEGQTVILESRWSDGKFERFPDLAAELVRAKVDVIFASVAASAHAARQASSTIPIVTVVNDPVAAGFVTNLARPGGNITGLSMLSPEVVGKQMELLKAVVPRISRLAILWNPTNPGHPPQLQQAEITARTLGMQLQPLKAQTPEEIDRAFAAMTRARADALLVLLDPILLRRRAQIAELEAKSRLPTVHGARQAADRSLMAYGADLLDRYKRAAIHVDKILKGAKPGDLPIEQPTKFELAVNLKTAKALGLTIPPSVLVRADLVIGQ
jgi:putative ABC transport system substrate-binding protein